MADVTPPAASPQVPRDESPRHDTAEVPVTTGVMRRAFRLNEIYTLIVAVLASGAALLGGYRVFISEARAAGKEEAAAVEKRTTALEGGQTEMQKDVRALYFVILTGKKSERLEQPLPLRDGGP